MKGMLKKAASGVLAILPCSRTESTLRASKGLRPCWTDFFEHSLQLMMAGSSRPCIGLGREMFNRPMNGYSSLVPFPSFHRLSLILLLVCLPAGDPVTAAPTSPLSSDPCALSEPAWHCGAASRSGEEIVVAQNLDADAHVGLALKSRSNGDLDGAITSLKKALELQPDHLEARHHLALALQDKGELDKAIHYLREIIRQVPDSPEAYSNLGNALEAKKDFDGAIQAYQTAITLNPKYGGFHYNLGYTLSVKGDYEAAITEYRNALRLDPDHANAHNNLGLLLHKAGQVDSAMEQYREAIRRGILFQPKVCFKRLRSLTCLALIRQSPTQREMKQRIITLR